MQGWRLLLAISVPLLLVVGALVVMLRAGGAPAGEIALSVLGLMPFPLTVAFWVALQLSRLAESPATRGPVEAWLPLRGRGLRRFLTMALYGLFCGVLLCMLTPTGFFGRPRAPRMPRIQRPPAGAAAVTARPAAPSDR